MWLCFQATPRKTCMTLRRYRVGPVERQGWADTDRIAEVIQRQLAHCMLSWDKANDVRTRSECQAAPTLERLDLLPNAMSLMA